MNNRPEPDPGPLSRREALALGVAAACGGMAPRLLIGEDAPASPATRPATTATTSTSSAPASAPTTAAAVTRERRPLNDGWRFLRSDAPDAARPEFDDAAWQPIDLPHTWNASDGQDGGNDYYRGPAWYRRPLSLPADWLGRPLFLRFGAANTVAEVFLNGVSVGSHRGGFSAFECSLGEAAKPLHFDAPNLLAVRVDNSHFDDVPPWSADFTFFGGLYRGVEVVAPPPVHVARDGSGGPGVRLTVRSLSAAAASVLVELGVRNAGPQRATTRIDAEIRTAEGVVASHAAASQTINPGRAGHARIVLDLPNPRRWHARRDPYMYEVHVRVTGPDGTLDEVILPLGLREMALDPERGFLINGEPYRLHGVNRHQDRMDRGWAIGAAEHAEDLALIMDLGCTAVRLAHYPHDPAVYAACDRLGLVVWAEIPLIDRIHGSPEFDGVARRQLTEMIVQLRHHPSIACWGVHNEITAPWKSGGPDPTDLVQQLHRLARRLDPARLTVCAACDPVDHPANWATDATAFNRYFGWYDGEPEGFAAWIDELHRRRPQTALAISEYGAGASIHHHEDPPRKPRHDGDWHPEEWQDELHQRHWEAMRERPWLWGTFVWNMFDFASDARREGDLPGRNDKGLVTFDRRTKKDAYFYYQSQWSDTPMVHLAMQRFTPRRGSPVVRARAYSNCPAVELFVNGASCGSADGRHGVFEWPAVELRPGPNALRAVARGRGPELESTAEWVLEAGPS